ncbi:hypothetical protein B0H11DRAFT_2218465 [Mycena galericulata]|nr:hypothetical protein B0H11DRAFT_2259286 [Mycena galericulata]KAJ7441341.1 hypothetical protein B0H11DRAFT_2252231 [Mycena galericulata]KAJ7506302.1 hypothetical protein B0H11DRAFT_2220229 [Mycena galericulata]KAJ7507628.1 hypothetical protein B0H11DRAFT_2218465 [Mycena galericulata]
MDAAVSFKRRVSDATLTSPAPFQPLLASTLPCCTYRITYLSASRCIPSRRARSRLETRTDAIPARRAASPPVPAIRLAAPTFAIFITLHLHYVLVTT